MRPVATRLFVLVCLACLSATPAAAQALLPRPVHLGVAGAPEWDDFAGKTPAGASLALSFEAQANDAECALLIRQADVKQDWVVEVNGRPIGGLARMEADLVHVLPIPPGVLRNGPNTLRVSSKVRDDIVLHEVVLHRSSAAHLLGQAHLHVTVVGPDGRPVPARVTVLDDRGALAALAAEPGVRAAVRPGVAYTAGDVVKVGLLPGSYRVRATRGPEYGMQEVSVVVGADETRAATLTIAREVPTDGWVAVDTHIHTLELSGHGDASLNDRMLTLAGEGVELAIATEHDREADYAPALAAMGATAYVTPVVGREVTTAKGHVNVFPARDSVRVLNHPHDVHSGFSPFSRANFNAVTGRSRGLEMTFDAMEVVNSGAMRTDWMEPIRSWFALLNRGLRVTPVGASDSHDVSRYIVGQGRTYVRAADASPGRIPVEDAVASFHAGRAVVSLGLYTQARIGNAGPGDLVRAGATTTIETRVLGPSWIAADRVALYVNGREIEHAEIPAARAMTIDKASVRWTLPARRHDYGVVVIASGPGVSHPSWAIARPYQPTTTTWRTVVFGLTSPILVDADGDGVFTAPRGYATKLVAGHQDLQGLVAALADHEAVVSAHAAELLEERGVDLASEHVRTALAAAAAVVRDGFAQYLAAK